MAHGSSLTGRAWRGGRTDWRMHTLSVFSLSVAFVCLVSALLVVTNLQALKARWARVGRATVYLKERAPEGAVVELRRALEKTKGVKAVRYVSPADARDELVGNSQDADLAALPKEAFSASLEVDFVAKASDAQVKKVASTLSALPVVDGVETYARWSERLGRLLRGGVLASLVLAIVVFGAVVSVVGSTMRMAMERRKIEVQILKLVGATDQFVRGPYVVEGAAQGAIGAAAAIGLLGVLYLIVRTKFDGGLATLLGVQPAFLPWFAALGLVALGAVLGAGSSFFSLRRLGAS